MLAFIFTVLLATSAEKQSTKSKIPLLDHFRAPLFAELDMNNVFKQLQEYIEAEIQIRVNETFQQGMETYVEAKSPVISGKGPAFTATFKHGAFKKLKKGEILRFDNVYLNRNNGYDKNTGYYTVPWSGVYQVSCVVRSNGGKHLHVFLWKNNETLALAYGENWNTGSLQMVLLLQKGDKLYIKHDTGPYVKDEEVQGGAASMFSVVYLSE